MKMEGTYENKQPDQVEDLVSVPGSLNPHNAPDLGKVGEVPDDFGYPKAKE